MLPYSLKKPKKTGYLHNGNPYKIPKKPVLLDLRTKKKPIQKTMYVCYGGPCDKHKLAISESSFHGKNKKATATFSMYGQTGYYIFKNVLRLRNLYLYAKNVRVKTTPKQEYLKMQQWKQKLMPYLDQGRASSYYLLVWRKNNDH